MVARDRLVQHGGALRPGPHDSVAVGEGSQHPAGYAVIGVGLLVVDAAAGRVQGDDGPPQVLGNTQDPPDQGFPGLVGHALRPTGVVALAQAGVGVGAQVGVEVGGVGVRPEDSDGQGVLGRHDGVQLPQRPPVHLGRVQAGAQHAAHPAGVPLGAHALGPGGQRGQFLAQVAGESGRGPGGAARRVVQSCGHRPTGVEFPFPGPPGPAVRLPGHRGGEVLGLPRDGLHLAARGRHAPCRGDPEGPGDVLQRLGGSQVATQQQFPPIDGGRAGRRRQQAAHLLEGRDEDVEEGAPVPGLDELGGGL